MTSMNSSTSTLSAPAITESELPEKLSKNDTNEIVYPPLKKSIVILAAIFLTQLLTSLDRLIVGVAIPSITDDFHSLGDVGWYGSAYLLTSCGFMLFVGRLYTLFNPKWIYMGSLLVFEVGSTICGAAPNSNALIIGRAVAGLGSAGLFQGAIILVIYIVPLEKRPQIMGFFGMIMGVASALGPLLGGAFTDGPGWRWCFYINLPCGAAALVMLFFVLNIPSAMLKRKSSTLKEKISLVDPMGTFFFVPCIVCLLLALQWGGTTYKWSDARIIALLVLFVVLLIAFLATQWWKGENATVPGHIFFNRSIMAGAWFSLFNGASMQTMFYFLPIWFQAIKGASAVKSGIMNLPMLIAMVVAFISAGMITKKVGYYTPWMIASSVIMPIGAGLISTFTPHTGHAAWIGYQVIFGFGFGCGGQQSSVAAQTVLPRKDVPIGASLMMFSQLLGGAIFVSVGNNLFDTQLATDLAKIAGISVGAVVKTGATDLRQMVPASLLPSVIAAYNDSLRNTFFLCVALASMTIFGSASMEWKSVKKGQQKGTSGSKQVEEEPKSKPQQEEV